MSTSRSKWYHQLLSNIQKSVNRLDLSTSPKQNIEKLLSWRPTTGEKIKYLWLIGVGLFSLFVMETPGFPLKLLIPIAYIFVLLIPLTSQFFIPASPIFAWLILFYSCKFIPASHRPRIWVSVLPTLETIWYGANISDILTQFGHPVLDILAWLPYGLLHFVAPFFVAAFLFIFAPPGSVKIFGQAFGFMMLIGVMIQILVPCAPPWYELREGLTPANYSMRGSPAGLARIDELFHSHGYTLTFTGAPMVFGAFPSLHAGNATLKALFCSYFFPIVVKIGRIRIDARVFYWAYCFWLYWCTMYLMHHYLIDLVAGACLATSCFYFFLTDHMRVAMEQSPQLSPHPLQPTSIPLTNVGNGVPYIGQQHKSDLEAQKTPQVIFSIDDSTDTGDLAGSSEEEESRKNQVASLLARTKSPIQRVRSPAAIIPSPSPVNNSNPLKKKHSFDN